MFGEFSLYASNGGLMSYRGSLGDMAQRVASNADRIFKGAKPADLPMERASTAEMVINLKTAQAPASRCRSRCGCGRMSLFKKRFGRDLQWVKPPSSSQVWDGAGPCGSAADFNRG